MSTFTPTKYITTAKGITVTIDTKGVSTIGTYDIAINVKATIDGRVITKAAPVKLDILASRWNCSNRQASLHQRTKSRLRM